VSPIEKKQVVQKSSLWRSIKMVAWSFLGIRKKSESMEDVTQVNPFHIIAVGIAGAIIFVISLIVLVNWVVAK
jgi:Protein of unknown function (DUF2970)